MITLLMILALSAHAEAKESDSQIAAVKFFESYIDYQRGLEGKTRTPKEAEAQDREATKPFFTAGYWRKHLALQKKCAASKDDIPEGCDADPFYCAQEIPARGVALLGNGKEKGNQAEVKLLLCFVAEGKAAPKMCKEPLHYTVHLRKDLTKNWLIDQIDCPK